MTRLTTWILSHRRLVLLGWLVLAIAGAALAPHTVDSLSYKFDIPGRSSDTANNAIADRFGNGGANDPLVVAVTGSSRLDSGRAADGIGELTKSLGTALQGSRVTSFLDPGSSDLLSSNGKTGAVVVYPRPVPGGSAYAEALPIATKVASRAQIEGVEVAVTGTAALKEDTGEGARNPLVETVFGALGALIVLALVFGSFLAVVPLVTAAFSILTTFLVVGGLTTFMDVSFIVQYLIALIGLGVAIDYALLVVTRWREALGQGQSDTEAVVTAMSTAGRSVAFSGVTVGVSLVSLLLLPVPFLRSVGITGLLIPLISVVASVTLLPVLLVGAGRRLSWPNKRGTDPHSHLWEKVARTVRRAPIPAALISAALLVALAVPALGMRLGSASPQSLASDGKAAVALHALDDAGLASGLLQPVQIVTTDPDRVVAATKDLSGVGGVLAPPSWQRDGTSVVDVWTAKAPSSEAGTATTKRVVDAVDDIAGTSAGGTPSADQDFISAVYGNLWLVLVLVGVLTFLLLARAFRSVLLPLKALLLNALSIGAAYGATVLIWQKGHFTELLFGTQPTGAITTWVPIAVFAFVFGLSMDYEVFILTRAREVWDRTGDNDKAIDESIATTGRLVTSAALILFLAFVALATVPVTDVKTFATALAIGIALDALVVRTILTPALVVLFGHLNWWAPSWLGGRSPRSVSAHDGAAPSPRPAAANAGRG